MPPQFLYTHPGSTFFALAWGGGGVSAVLGVIIIIIIIISFIRVFAGVLFVHQPAANHAPRASVNQVNHSVHTLITFLWIRADPSMHIV